MTSPATSPPPQPEPVVDPPPPQGAGSGWTGGRVVGLVVSSLLALVGIGLLLGGLALVAVDSSERDDDGFLTTDAEPLHSDAFAITTGNVDLGAEPAGWAPDDVLGTIRVTVEGTEGKPVFVGIAPSADVEDYLGAVGHSELDDFGDGEAQYEEIPGRAPDGPPADEDFWAAQSQGAGQQQLEWDSRSGDWSVVVMNADAGRDVTVEADVGAELDWLLWAGLVAAAIGLMAVIAGVILVISISRRAGRT